MEYLFGTKAAGRGCVPAAVLYEPGKQPAGFLTEENRKKYGRLGIPELNSGYDCVYWGQGVLKTCIREDEEGAYVDWQGQGDLPLTFVCDVPAEGNYRVGVTLAADRDADILIFLGRRRLAGRFSLKAGETLEKTFLTNICPIIPRTYEEPMEDMTCDVTIVGPAHLQRVSVEPWQGRTIYIAGDSTVTDQSADYPYLPGRSYCGWGQMLSAFVQLPVSNHSHSGLTTESFRSEGHYQILRDRIEPGDLCLIQFGHNDQKLMHLLAAGGYRDNLIRYIRELRELGAVPVLVTPLARNSWKGGSGEYNDLLEEYAHVCQKLGEEFQVHVLDLHKKSMDFVKMQGREAAKRYFFPSDYTHSNDYGAYLFAGYIYEELLELGLVTANTKKPGPWQPPEVLPVLEIPEECRTLENPADEHLFEDVERPGDILTRAEALDFIITAMHFFPTNVYNDMFTDVIGHETYAGTVECAWQNGLIPEDLIEDDRLLPQKQVDLGTFLHLLLNGYATRKDLPGGDECAQAQALGLLDAGAELSVPLTRGQAADMCRKLHI
jgi:lysophospholipase L1-like esterase